MRSKCPKGHDYRCVVYCIHVHALRPYRAISTYLILPLHRTIAWMRSTKSFVQSSTGSMQINDYVWRGCPAARNYQPTASYRPVRYAHSRVELLQSLGACNVPFPTKKAATFTIFTRCIIETARPATRSPRGEYTSCVEWCIRRSDDKVGTTGRLCSAGLLLSSVGIPE